MSLEDLRKKINELDARILDVLNERARITREIGEIKHQNNSPIFIPGREEEVYRRVSEMNNGPLRDESVRAVFREIMSGCRRTEFDLKICFLGPEATFIEFAARRKFGSSIEYYPARTIPRVFVEVERGEADYGVVPVENSSEGAVNQTLDMLIETDVKISAEILMEIHHALLATCSMSEITAVYSKPEAIAQCRVWLDNHLPDVELKPVGSTAEAAIIAARETGAAAIAHKMAGTVYGLNVIHGSIEDMEKNTTRFLVLGPELSHRTGDDKTSVMFAIPHQSGALYEALMPFTNHSVNLANLTPRPSRKRPWEYLFFADLFGHASDDRVTAALDELGKFAIAIKILGSYPVAKMPV
jgi:chorismate mutase/prephenate dehydratase